MRQCRPANIDESNCWALASDGAQANTSDVRSSVRKRNVMSIRADGDERNVRSSQIADTVGAARARSTRRRARGPSSSIIGIEGEWHERASCSNRGCVVDQGVDRSVRVGWNAAAADAGFHSRARRGFSGGDRRRRGGGLRAPRRIRAEFGGDSVAGGGSGCPGAGHRRGAGARRGRSGAAARARDVVRGEQQRAVFSRVGLRARARAGAGSRAERGEQVQGRVRAGAVTPVVATRRHGVSGETRKYIGYQYICGWGHGSRSASERLPHERQEPESRGNGTITSAECTHGASARTSNHLSRGSDAAWVRDGHHMQRHKIVSTIAALVASAGTIVALGGFTRPVDQSQANAIAIKACGGGTIKSESDGGMRNGDKVYTFDVNVANKSFVEKVNVDAKTGAVLDVTYAGQQA